LCAIQTSLNQNPLQFISPSSDDDDQS